MAKTGEEKFRAIPSEQDHRAPDATHNHEKQNGPDVRASRRHSNHEELQERKASEEEQG